MSEVIFEVRDGVGWIQLNRPNKLNAMTNELINQAIEAVEEIECRSDLVAMVLTGKGRGFCSGADTGLLFATGEGGAPAVQLDNRRVQQLTGRIFRMDVPTIAAVNGPAVGAGFELSLACDLRVATPSAFFQHAAMQNRLVSGDGSAFFLPRMIGLARSFDMLLTERRVMAEEARDIGLVRSVVPPDELEEEVQRLAQKIALSGSAVAMTKEAVRLGLDVGDPEPVFAYLRLAVSRGRSEHDRS